MIDEAARDAFEKCCAELGIGFESTQPFERDGEGDGYLHVDVDNAWKLWNTARAESARTPAGDVVGLCNFIRNRLSERFQGYQYAREGAPEYAAVSDLAVTFTRHLQETLPYLNKLEAAIAAMQPVQVDIGWQPIETAPRDKQGAELLLASYITPSAEAARNGSIAFWHYGLGRFVAGTWTGILGGKPTHWMPLPAVPMPDASDPEDYRSPPPPSEPFPAGTILRTEANQGEE